MKTVLRERIGWLMLVLLDIPFLIAQFDASPNRVRTGLTPTRESLLHAFVFLLMLAGLWFRWSPLVLWPSFAAMISQGLVVSGLSALAHTVLFVLLGTVFGVIHVALRGLTASHPSLPPTS